MKALIITFLCFGLITHTAPRKIKVVIHILPELRELVKTQPIQIDITSKDFSYQATKSIEDSLVLDFDYSQAISFDVATYATLRYSDSSERFFRTGARFTLDEKTSVYSLNFPTDCSTNRYMGGKTCPTCRKSNSVIPVLFGLLIPGTPGIPEIDYYPMGCITSDCDPSWYCKTDSLAF